ncbi:Retrovirus-related Pol polyprotein from transposon TNT 1-94 [Cucumis melo var. makuwa]|uniref:Retrovirus-related Pol polyprotein from transposon TNT 1-94 n=1 Tax=Cucumis melo var. makuwa TaxID=1194695 RepID=A0A5D3CI59_CUCMM|nr:Retrovirus-related Pol polyprotein from transposon TNT 1-94 [Cucumis melo var. makuwa]
MARGRSDKKSWKGKEKSSRMNSKGKLGSVSFVIIKGHFKKHCPLNKSKEASSSKHVGSEANVTDGYDLGYGSVEVLMMSHRDIQNAWIMDLRCTYHMTPNQDFLINFQKSDGGKVLLGDNSTYQVKEIGSIQIATHDGMIRKLTNARYFPELKRNLISLGTVVSGSATKALKQQKQQIVDHVVIEVRIDGVQSSGKGSNERTLINEGVCSDSIAFDLKKQRKDAMEAVGLHSDGVGNQRAASVFQVFIDEQHRFRVGDSSVGVSGGLFRRTASVCRRRSTVSVVFWGSVQRVLVLSSVSIHGSLILGCRYTLGLPLNYR